MLASFGGHTMLAIMQKPLEMYTASRMQNMWQIRKKSAHSLTNLLFKLFEKVLLGRSALRAPAEGPFVFCGSLSNLLAMRWRCLGYIS